MNIQEYIDNLTERAEHSDTMYMAPIEYEWLKDLEAHRDALNTTEREFWLKQDAS